MKNINEDTIFKLGQKIRIERVKRNLSQEKLAELANLNRNFIGMVERGETNITVKNLETIANVFEIDIKDLFIFVI
jgi:transcriptional regulator with XRE-family HTH domain